MELSDVQPLFSDDGEDFTSSPSATNHVKALMAHAEVVYRIAFGMSGSPTRAEALLHDTYAQAVREIALLPRVSDLEPWLLHILWEQCRMQLNDIAMAASQSGFVFMALPLSERFMLLLRDVANYPPEKVGWVFEGSAMQIRTRLHHTRCRLTRRLMSTISDSVSSGMSG